MIEAVKKRGIIVGVYLGIRRLCRCNPWNKNGWGYDPVPEKKSKQKEKQNDKLIIRSDLVSGGK
jgi:putative component of membrane protein insertase Oxa1/YidC/SpoIIIJ protein YidD